MHLWLFHNVWDGHIADCHGFSVNSDDGVVNVPLVLGMLFGVGIVGGVVVSGAVNRLNDYGVITDLRLMVGL